MQNDTFKQKVQTIALCTESFVDKIYTKYKVSIKLLSFNPSKFSILYHSKYPKKVKVHVSAVVVIRGNSIHL